MCIYSDISIKPWFLITQSNAAKFVYNIVMITVSPRSNYEFRIVLYGWVIRWLFGVLWWIQNCVSSHLYFLCIHKNIFIKQKPWLILEMHSFFYEFGCKSMFHFCRCRMAWSNVYWNAIWWVSWAADYHELSSPWYCSWPCVTDKLWLVDSLPAVATQ